MALNAKALPMFSGGTVLAMRDWRAGMIKAKQTADSVGKYMPNLDRTGSHQAGEEYGHHGEEDLVGYHQFAPVDAVGKNSRPRTDNQGG